MTRLWAALERIVPRGLLAGSVIALAFVSDPYAIGLYTWAALALTFYSALTEAPIQHVAMISIGSTNGRAFLRRYAWVSGFAGVFFMAAAVWLIAERLGRNSTFVDFINLSPFILVPVSRAFAAQKTALLQYSGLWQKVMMFRSYGAVIGAAIGLPIIFINKSILGACITITASEICYTTFVFFAVTRSRTALRPSNEETRLEPWDTYRHMAMFSMLGWLSSQLERLLLGAWAGTATLGVYSFGFAIGRSAGEAIASSQPSVLRADLTRSAATSDGQIKKLLSGNLRGGLYLTVGTALAVTVLSIYVLPIFLGDKWSDALEMAPILALSAIPSAVAQSAAPVFVQMQRAHLSYLAPALLLFFAPVVASAAVNSLTLAAWTVLLRECLLATIQSLLLGHATPWREVFLAFFAVAAGALIVATLIS